MSVELTLCMDIFRHIEGVITYTQVSTMNSGEKAERIRFCQTCKVSLKTHYNNYYITHSFMLTTS